MHTYKLAVCEDDSIVREGICRFCGEVLAEEKISHEITAFSDAKKLEEALLANPQAFDLLLLDIALGEQNGMELALELRKWDEETSILFITGCEEYMAMGYEVEAVQFLLKPVVWEKLKAALLKDWRRRNRQTTICLQKGRQRLKLSLRKVLYVETHGNHNVMIRLEDGEEQFPAGLAELENQLPAGQFVRCHNSYLVNVNRVRRIEKSKFILDNEQKIPISRKYLKTCQEVLVSHINQ